MPDNVPSHQKPQQVSPKGAKSAPVATQFQIEATFAQHFRGPLPPPELLDHYEKILPGGAERIFRMAEKEQDHRHALEKTLPELAKWGQRFGFFLGMAGILGGVYLVATGKSIEGFGVFLVSLGSLVGAYMYGHKVSTREPQRQERGVSSKTPEKSAG
jgi:uncharacterized membrane protein